MKATMYLGFVCLWIFLFSSVVECKYFMHLFFCFIFKFLTLRPLVSCMLPDHSSFHFFLLIRLLHACFKGKRCALISDHKIVSILMSSLNARLLHTFISKNKYRVHGEVSQQKLGQRKPCGGKEICLQVIWKQAVRTQIRWLFLVDY